MSNALLIAAADTLRAQILVELPDSDARTACARLLDEVVANVRLVEVLDDEAQASALYGGDFAALRPVERAAWIGVVRARALPVDVPLAAGRGGGRG